MYDLGIALFILGWVVGLAGYAGVLLNAMKHGFFWVIALLVIPFFVFFLLFVDFQRTWKPLLVNFVGGLIMQVGLVVWVLAAHNDATAASSASGSVQPVRDTGIPAVPGAWTPPDPQDAGFFASVDPMLFALLGGLFVFGIVGLIAGGILIGGMGDPDEAQPG